MDPLRLAEDEARALHAGEEIRVLDWARTYLTAVLLKVLLLSAGAIVLAILALPAFAVVACIAVL